MERKIRKVLILGSGGLRIGQAGEFDYSGSQAIKALKQEGIETVLINPNIATVQTDSGLADRVYLQPLNLETAKRIIAQEQPDGILLGFGGQTALNLGLQLDQEGVLREHNVRVLGTQVSSITTTEDRSLFKQALEEIDVHTCRSAAVETVEAALEAAEEIGFPLMIRSGYALGGLGSGRVDTVRELKTRCQEALAHAPHVLVEEYLHGWKEVEYEVVRDCEGNILTVCNMENLDPMGIHTGESIVIAPSQTLSNRDYHFLREVALKTVSHLGIVGECNIQYALDPKSGDYRVIEVNARLSRSSALASKATGYPLAYVAAKLSLGIPLHQLRNAVTGKTSAFFEPALDYVVVKMPRWDIQKFRTADRRIGSEMKSVGEVMAIGRSFPEALQKAVRMLNVAADGLGGYSQVVEDSKQEIAQATDRRLFALYQYFLAGGSTEEAHALSQIDRWFLEHIAAIAALEQQLAKTELSTEWLHRAKKMGFSDAALAKIYGREEEEIRQERVQRGICPRVKQIDTLAGEFAAQTNYLYTTYHGCEHDLEPAQIRPIAVLGSGPYSIGSSVEFDWCAVNTLRSLRQRGKTTVMINSNPETVSTDFDESDRLYFEELTAERVRDILDFEQAEGVVVSVGGQCANNLAVPLDAAGYSLLGTKAQDIDRAENRRTFSALLGELGVDQPEWQEVRTLEQVRTFAHKVGYPILVRPSYVLSGAAMSVVYSDEELAQYLGDAVRVSRGQPVVVSDFIEEGKELEIDGVAQEGEIMIEAITEHIENAGVHSGDATVVMPPQRLYLETIRRTKRITRQIVAALKITGPFNIQFIAKNNSIKVIECNVRASRSFPFVSKVSRHHFIDLAVEAFLGKAVAADYETLELDWVGVKSPQFSYARLKGANPVAQVEMASTGEVACLGEDLHHAFMRSWLASGLSVQGKRLLVSIGGESKGKCLPWLKVLEASGWELFATEGTQDFLAKNGVATRYLHKASEHTEPSTSSVIEGKQVDLIINIPTNRSHRVRTDGYLLRRLAIDHNIPLITNLQIAQVFLQCLAETDLSCRQVKAWQDYGRRETYAYHL